MFAHFDPDVKGFGYISRIFAKGAPAPDFAGTGYPEPTTRSGAAR